MGQNVIPGREYVSRSGNGMQGTKQTGKTQSSKRQSSSSSAKTAYSNSKNTSGIACDIAEGSRRVSQWLYGGQSYAGTDGMFDGAGEVYLTSNVYQQAVDQVKQAQAEAEMVQEEENTEQTEDTAEGTAVGNYDESKLEYMERLLEDMKKSRKANASNKNSKKRALNYSHSRVSGAIMRAKSVTQANNALSSAKSNLISLSRKRGSKLYNSKEVEIAISHAKKMIRTARKKVYNIKNEERQRKLDNDVENGAERKHAIIKRQQRGSSAAAENAKIEKEMFRLKKMMKSNREQRKNRHRADENQELLLADMEYLKRKIELMRQEREVQQAESSQVRESMATGETMAESGASGSGEGSATGTTQGTAGTGTTSTPSAAEVAASGFDATV